MTFTFEKTPKVLLRSGVEVVQEKGGLAKAAKHLSIMHQRPQPRYRRCSYSSHSFIYVYMHLNPVRTIHISWLGTLDYNLHSISCLGGDI